MKVPPLIRGKKKLTLQWKSVAARIIPRTSETRMGVPAKC